MRHFDCLIVGAGHAGAQAALALRQHKFEGNIGLLGEETELPYDRPPLSKDYLAGNKPFERLLLRPREVWAARAIEMLQGYRVTGVDAGGHTVSCADGSAFSYGRLIWATGGKPRRLSCPGNELAGVHSVRTRADVDAIMGELPRVQRVVVIGGGYIGLEAAAVLSGLGKSVTVLEAAPRVLARVAGEPLSRFYESEHRARGVDIRLDSRLERVEGDAGRVTGVRMMDGELIAADMVVVGIGIVPAVVPLIAAGAAGGDGVDVDAMCRTSLADVFAIGDCARHVNAFAGGQAVRLESVQNANDQATAAAKFIAGQHEPYHAVPWFWSDQYDLRLQTVGLSKDHDQVVVRGDPAQRRFSLVYLREGRVLAIDCVNMTRDFVEGKALVAGGVRPDLNLLSDACTTLKSLALPACAAGAAN